MPKRVSPWLVLGVLLVSPAAGRAADAAAPPTFTLQVRSLDGLLDDAKYLATLAGKEDEAKQIDGFLRAKIGQKGLDGIDPKRPLGMYSLLARGANVGLIPIANEEAFLGLLENLNLKATKDDDGIYAVTPEFFPVTVYFRFANKYAYVTALTKTALTKDNLLDPESVLPANAANVVTAVWQLDQIPDALKQIGLQQVQMRFTEEEEKQQPGETEAQHNLRVQALRAISNQLTLAVKDGRRLEVRLNLDRTAQVLVAEANLTGASGSPLAKEFAHLGQSQSLFGGLTGPDAAMSALLHVALPDQVRTALGPAIDEGIRSGLAKEKDAAKREQARRFLDALRPTLKAGVFDAGFRLGGPVADQHYTFLGGARLKDGQKLEQALRDLVNILPPREKSLVKLDAEKVGDANVHRLDAQKTFDANARQTLGDNPIYLAVVPDALWLAAGPDGLGAIKAALAAAPKVAPQLQVEMALARLAPAIARGNKQNASQVTQAAAKAFGQGGKDKVVFSLEGGKALRVRFVLDAPVIRFLTALPQAGK
jgi:hypothetical protein